MSETKAKRTAYHHFSTWRRDGTWERICSALQEKRRKASERKAEPRAAIINSQSVKRLQWGLHGYDAGKKITGPK